MSALDLLRALSSVAFLLVALASAANFLRHRRREHLAALLFFGALGVVIVAGFALATLGVGTGDRWVSLALIVVFLAIPVLELNLVAQHARLHRRAMPLAVAGFALSTIPLLVLDPVPAWLGVPIIGYFFIAGTYAALALVRESRGRSGPSRQRVRLGAAGAFLLGLTLLSAALRPVSADLADLVSRLLGLACALAFLLAFAPPSVVRRAWLEPIVRNLLLGGPTVLAKRSTDEMLAELERLAIAAVGASAALVRIDGGDAPSSVDATLWETAGSALVDIVPVDAMLEADDGAIVAMPIAVGADRLGAIAVRFARRPMFMDTTRAILSLVAMNAAVLLTSVRATRELQQRNTELEAANRAAQEATKAKSEFLANMSHELRTPLNSILGFSEVLSDQLGATLNERQTKFLKNIHDAGAHLLKLINDVLDLSKVEARRIELRRETVPLDAALAEVTPTASADAARRGLTLVVDCEEGLAIDVDPLRFRQILLNLLTNALKFTPAPGTVTLRARAMDDALDVEVQDTGVGIPADKVDRVFGTFERFHEGRYEAEGTGLGLALTKQLVELHDGTISFVTAEGSGTCFAIRIPGAIVTTSDERVLVVEDEARDAQLIVTLAKRAGLGTEVAASLESARRAIARRRPLAVVLDLHLPDGHGNALLTDLSAKRVPTIVVTVEDDEGLTRSEGADDHLTKPIDHERLSGWLRQIALRSYTPAREADGAFAAR